MLKEWVRRREIQLVFITVPLGDERCGDVCCILVHNGKNDSLLKGGWSRIGRPIETAITVHGQPHETLFTIVIIKHCLDKSSRIQVAQKQALCNGLHRRHTRRGEKKMTPILINPCLN